MRKAMVLAAVVCLLAACAAAEETPWGIMRFMKEQGVEISPEWQVQMIAQQSDGGVARVQVEQALVCGEKLYLALTVTPAAAQTLAVPSVPDVTGDGSIAVMDHVDYDPCLSVAEYAREKGCTQVLTVALQPRNEEIWGLEYASYDHGPAGELRMILQYGCDAPPEVVEMEAVAGVYNLEQPSETETACWKLEFELK